MLQVSFGLWGGAIINPVAPDLRIVRTHTFTRTRTCAYTDANAQGEGNSEAFAHRVPAPTCVARP